MEETWQRIDRLVEEFDRLEAPAARRLLGELEEGTADRPRSLEILVLRELLSEAGATGLDLGARGLLGESLEEAFDLVETGGDESELGPGDEVDSFRLVDRLGQGGMGTVFLARRSDGSFDQRVALKVLRNGPADESSRRRFLRERQILASLRHPHIARLLDGGTIGGAPYLVLEYVDGVPITDYCVRRDLPVPDRLRIFLQVCGAIRLAHLEGVVHRDLKPSNVLVEEDGEGRPRAVVLDFGIARVEHEGERTMTGHVLGTPGYVAPEQLHEGKTVGPECDVYALGCLLHELVSGRRRFDGATRAEVLRRVWAAEPSPLRSHLPGVDRDLETVVETASALEPERRYSDVGALILDLELLLASEPVRARRVPRWERWWRRARRHPQTVAAITSALLFAAGSLGLWLASTARHARELARERNEAVAARAEAEGLLEFMVDDLHSGLDRLGRLDLLEQVARRSIEYQERWGGDDRTVEVLLAEGPDAVRRRTAVRANAGQILVSRGDLPGAIAAYRQNHRLLERVARADDDPRWLLELAGARRRLASAHESAGEVDVALSWARRAAQLIDDPSLVDLPPDIDPPLSAVRFDVLILQGWLERESGSVSRSLEVIDRALELAKESAEKAASKALRDEWRGRQAEALGASGLSHRRAGAVERARRAFRDAISLHRDLVASDPANTLWREELQLHHQRLGDLLMELGEAESARRSLEDARRHAVALVELEPHHVGWLRELAMADYGLAAFHSGRGEVEIALRYAEASLETTRRLAERGPRTASVRNDLAADLLEVGRLRREVGDVVGAETALQEGLVEIVDVVREEPGSPYYLDTHVHLLLELGRLDEARQGFGKLQEVDGSWPGIEELRERLAGSAGS